MRTSIKRVLAALLLVVVAVTVNAGSKEKLVSSIKKEIRGQESQIVSMWMAGKRDATLDKVLADYLVKNVRLQAMGGTPTPLYTKVNSIGREYKTSRDFAKAIVLEYFKSKGIKFDDMDFVHGKYSLKVADAR